MTLAAFFGALAGIFLVTRGATALQADLLATAYGHGYAIWQHRLRAALAVCFGSDFVGHRETPVNKTINPRLGHKASRIFQVCFTKD
jgi:hypothetical protein